MDLKENIHMHVRCSVPTHAEEAPLKITITLCALELLLIVIWKALSNYDYSFGFPVLQWWEIDALLVKNRL